MQENVEQSIVVLLVPHGAARSRRLEIPMHVARWLRDELNLVLDEEPRGMPAQQQPRRKCRLRRGRWLEARP